MTHPRQHRILLNNHELLMRRALNATDWDYKTSCIKAANEAEDELIRIIGFFARHGERMECPTCGAKGTWDQGEERQVGDKAVVGTTKEDAIFYNPLEKQVECYDCWLK